MEQTKCKNNVIVYKKPEIKSIIKDFREIITQCGFKYKKSVIKNLRKRLRSDKKTANDEDNEDDMQLM